MSYSLLRNRITVVWFALIVATCLSWETVGNIDWAFDYRIPSIIVLGIAFVKVRYVMLEFMELRHAPLPMRLVAEAWSLGVCAALVAYYWLAAPWSSP